MNQITTNTVLHSTKKDIGQWVKFAWCIVRGFSLRRCHDEVEISARTAFFWRHKILFAISKTLKTYKVDGVVETDETYFLESAKGKRGIDWLKIGRTARKRGGTAEKRGISDEQVCVICSLDRIGNILSEATGKAVQNRLILNDSFTVGLLQIRCFVQMSIAVIRHLQSLRASKSSKSPLVSTNSAFIIFSTSILTTAT